MCMHLLRMQLWWTKNVKYAMHSADCADVCVSGVVLSNAAESDNHNAMM